MLHFHHKSIAASCVGKNCIERRARATSAFHMRTKNRSHKSMVHICPACCVQFMCTTSATESKRREQRCAGERNPPRSHARSRQPHIQRSPSIDYCSYINGTMYSHITYTMPSSVRRYSVRLRDVCYFNALHTHTHTQTPQSTDPNT